MPRPTQRTLYWDCETRSTVDLRKAGLYVYASHPTTSVTVARLALDKEPPHEWRPGQALPQKYIQAFEDHNVRVVAHNAAFERIVLRDILGPRHGWPVLPIWRFDCTMARARIQALPGSLDGAANAAGLDVRKDLTGHQLMMRMCRPRAVKDGVITWWEDEDRMRRLSDYCAVDVKVERALDTVLQSFPAFERGVWEQTEIMNDRGLRFDLSFVAAARVVAEDTREMLDTLMSDLTGRAVERCTQLVNLKRYLIGRGVNLEPPPELQRDNQPWMTPVAELLLADDDDEPERDDDARESLPDLRRRDIMRILADPTLKDHDKAVLRLRLEAGKISTRKLDAIRERADADGVVRGLLGYHGANTGRYISQGLQIQNFPRETVADWEEMRELLDAGPTLVDALAGPPLDVISRMLRGAIIPRPGHCIMAGDYSSVEAVGLAWLAGQSDLLDAFERKEKVYERMAAAVYGHLRVEDILPDSIHRHVGKTLVLGAGYQMGWWKFRETVLMMTGTLLTPVEAENAIRVYRDTFKCIHNFWYDIEDAAKLAVQVPGRITQVAGGHIRFLMERSWLRMRLPSGRYLWYAKPLLEANPNRDGQEQLTYFGVNNKTRKWERQHTYGGRLTENAVQGLCRDLLVDATIGLEAADYRPVALVHDEAICEPAIGHGSVDEMLEIMCDKPDWAKGFPLSAKGRAGHRYTK